VKIYDRLADVYDRGGWESYSRRMFPYLEKVLRRYRFQGKLVAELACGTGTLAIALSRQGYQVVGVDRSESMLRVAREKARRTGTAVTFLQQDIRRLNLDRPVDLATCFFDSMNYLLSYGDLVKTFCGVHRALHPGGLFIFDMNTATGLASRWDTHDGSRDLGDIAIIGSSRYDSKAMLGTIRITVFRKISSGGVSSLYEKFSEEHTERAYPDEEVRAALQEGGLHPRASYDCMTFRKPNKATGRILYVAKKP
jgi:SAM-dependent methyltransferase